MNINCNDCGAALCVTKSPDDKNVLVCLCEIPARDELPTMVAGERDRGTCKTPALGASVAHKSLSAATSQTTRPVAGESSRLGEGGV